ncbi:MAG: haloacid dehalogenase, partial [Actinomycetia bacterium]|nr:haloacid dehalogenase [Actinomycetes bacterium]
MVPDFPLRIHAICFDAFGTLIDISTINEYLERKFPTLGERIGAEWRRKQIDYTRLRSIGGKYKPFGEVTQDAL